MARDFEKDGYSVWWDTKLIAGDEFPKTSATRGIPKPTVGKLVRARNIEEGPNGENARGRDERHEGGTNHGGDHLLCWMDLLGKELPIFAAVPSGPASGALLARPTRLLINSSMDSMVPSAARCGRRASCPRPSPRRWLPRPAVALLRRQRLGCSSYGLKRSPS